MSLSPPIKLFELRAQLARRNMTQWQLAAQLGMSPSALSAILRGHADVPADFAARVAAVLGIEIGLLTDTTAD